MRFFGAAHAIPDPEGRIDDVIDFTNLRARQHDPVVGLSGGMKQRVSLACALVHRPRLLLLDEPTAGVDPKLREAFWGHFRNLASQGVTLLVSTHLMDEALFCDRVAVMRDGAVLACDSPSALLRQGRTRVSIWRGESVERNFLANYPDELPAHLRLQGLEGITRIELDGDTLETVVLGLINRREQSPPYSVAGTREKEPVHA